MLFFGLNEVSSQELYSKVLYGTGFEELQSISITETFDNGYIMSGIRNYNNLLLKIDEEANTIWNLRFGQNYGFSNEVITLSDSNFMFVGNHIDPIIDYPLIFCVKFDTHGEIIWTSYIDMGTGFKVESVIETVDSGFTIVGQTIYPEAPYNKMGLVHLNFLGEFEWAREMEEGDHSNNAKDVIQSPIDSSYWITGVSTHSSSWESKGFLMHVSSSGEIENANYYYSANGMNNSELHNVLLDNDSLVINMTAGSDVIMKTDLNGEPEWAKRYSGWGEFCMYEIKSNEVLKVNDSTYYMISGSSVFNISTNGDFRHSTFFWMCVSGFGYSGTDEIMVIGNGPILGVNGKLPNDPQIGITNLGLDGVAYQDCSEVDHNPYNDTISIYSEPMSFDIEEVGQQASSNVSFSSHPIQSQLSCVAFIGSVQSERERKFKVYPVPTSGVLNIEAIERNNMAMFQITSLEGVSVYVGTTSPGKTQVDLSHLTDGLYFLKIIGKDTEVHQILIQR